jgi:hypothetical protein
MQISAGSALILYDLLVSSISLIFLPSAVSNLASPLFPLVHIFSLYLYLIVTHYFSKHGKRINKEDSFFGVLASAPSSSPQRLYSKKNMVYGTVTHLIS